MLLIITFLKLFSELHSESRRQSLSTGQEHEGSEDNEGAEDDEGTLEAVSVVSLTVEAVSVVADEYPCSLIMFARFVDIDGTVDFIFNNFFGRPALE